MTIAQKEQYSKILIWIGLLAWLPYIILQLIGKNISVASFLLLHLSGVSGGLILRNQIQKSLPPPSKKVNQLKTFSTTLLFLGLSVWLLYFLLGLAADQPLEIRPFLIVHLAFMFTGAGIKMYVFSSR